jgi:D-beta-D-heptose 7-phosphate kinase/D-beta-D-heptose 1-phosphate adenosyltransferase
VHIAADAREVYDVSGAGDTVIATLAVAVGCGVSDDVAARLANAAAGIVVGKLGTAPIAFADLQRVIQTNGLWRGHHKIMPLRDLVHHLSVWRSAGKRVVLTNGCFDLLHVGHVTLLEQAAELGDVLVVGLNADSSVRRIKGSGRPVNDEHHRALLLAGLTAVDAVVIVEEDTPVELLRALRPDILVKGGEYCKEEEVGGSFVESYGGKVVLIPVVEGYSTTRLLHTITDRARELSLTKFDETQ